jgi:ATP-dependent exoDNAse (exonuclease V) alpha subunit
VLKYNVLYLLLNLYAMESLSAEANYVLQFINQTNRSIFLTGKAGTGKTTLLKEIIKSTHKNCVVVAPTGIAALNAGGVTIHSMFQLPFGGFIPDNSKPQFLENSKFETKATLRRHFKMSGLKKSVIQNMELLIIDEVSMLRSDLMDAIDFMLQSVRRKNLPFGGVQVLFIGDLLQLPPIIRDEEWRTLRSYYKGKFFFHSHVIQQNPPLYIELSKIFRQTDEQFISVLNNLRNNQISQNDIQILNQFVQPNFDLKANKGYITLTTHNVKADSINSQSLLDLNGKSKVYKALIVDDFPEKIYPLEEKLELKVGAQVMFIKNDLSFDKNYFNGKMGVIKSLSDEEIMVHFPEENKTIEVERYEWQNIRYYVDENTKEINEEVLGTFTHYPIKLAWAITVHKSQGLTFDKAALDVSQVFLPGQAYVALSRLRSLNGLVLLSPLQMNGI